jgi:hypothetical protein
MHPLTAARIAARIAASATFPDLSDRLAVLFPGIDFVADVEIRDDGSGPRIAAWHRPEPQPTEAELRAVVIPLPDLVITDLQARLWLNAAGFYESAVQSLIDAIPDPVARENARAVWDRALTIHLSHPLTQSLGAALGLDAAQLRAAFLAAAAL